MWFGSLVDHLRRRGFEAIGVDLLAFQISAGRDRFPEGNPSQHVDPLPFADQAFDTVVFKDSLHHVAAEADVNAELAEVARVCFRRLIVFEPNPSIPRRIGRALIRHGEPVLPARSSRSLLESAGFDVTSVQYLAAGAFPLRREYVGKPLLSPRVTSGLLRLDDQIVNLLGSRVAWRYLIVADKPALSGTLRTDEVIKPCPSD